MNIAGIDKFFHEIHKANKKFILEVFEEWQVYQTETLKATVEATYPEGFKDFLVEKLDDEIKKNAPKK